jgi:ceramide glucosyltransferase
MSVIIYLLAAWSMAALGWWLAAWWLVRGHRFVRAPEGPRLEEVITIFKPLPRLGPGGAHAGLRAALASFAAQLDAQTEMLVGVHEADRAVAQSWLDELQALAPAGCVRLFFRAEADAHANPKIAWQAWLAPHARGAWWLWSDADIAAPPGWLEQARRAALAFPRANLVTFPYHVRRPAHDQGWWDAAFVNAEILPGACLMHALGREVDFAFGAAMLFRSEDFLRKCDWAALGRNLADDFAVGQLLQPCHISFPALETLAEENSWRGALRHYQRWHKTIRWCQPSGYAAQILINPLLGWLLAALIFPATAVIWIGLALQYVGETCAILALTRQAAGHLPRGKPLLALAAWPALRSAMWVASWLPIGVRWRDRHWNGPQSTEF